MAHEGGNNEEDEGGNNGLAQTCNLSGSSTSREQMRGPVQATGPVQVGGGRRGEQRWMGGVDKRLNKCE